MPDKYSVGDAEIRSAYRTGNAAWNKVKPDVSNIDPRVVEMYKRLTEGAENDQERRKRIEAFAAAVAAMPKAAPVPAQHVPTPKTLAAPVAHTSDAMTESSGHARFAPAASWQGAPGAVMANPTTETIQVSAPIVPAAQPYNPDVQEQQRKRSY